MAHREERLRDRLVSGIYDKKLRQEVLKTPIQDLTLDVVLQTCNYEASNEVNDRLSGTVVNTVRSMSTYKKSIKNKSNTWKPSASAMKKNQRNGRVRLAGEPKRSILANVEPKISNPLVVEKWVISEKCALKVVHNKTKITRNKTV